MLSEAPSLVLDAGQVAGAMTAIGAFCALIWQVVKRTIVSQVRPMVEDVRAASKAQHDDQNHAIEQGFQSVHKRLDTTDSRLEKLETRNEAVRRTDHAADVIIEAVHDAGAA